MPKLTPRKLCDLVVQALDDGKAEDIKSVDVRKLTSIADFMVIATGRSSRQVKGLADRVLEAGRDHDLKPLGVEGESAAEWILVDFGDVIVHAIILTESDEALKKAAPDDARFATASDATYGLEHLKLSPQETRVAIAMDGTKTISDLLALFDQVPPRVIRGLAAGLFCLHLTHLKGRGPARARNISFF